MLKMNLNKTLLSLMVMVMPAVALGQDAVAVYEQVADKVYTVFGHDDDMARKALGSAVAVSEQYLATSCHAGFSGRQFKVKLQKKLLPARVVYEHPQRDLCLLAVAEKTFQPVSMIASNQVLIGEEVYAVANPHGLEKSITRGIISNKHRVGGDWMLQTDATLAVGSSGGGVFNNQAKLIGIIRSGHRFKDIGFVIPSEWVQTALREADKKGLQFPVPKVEKKLKLSQQFTLLGMFGEKKISLYKHQQQCFIVIRADTTISHHDGFLFWFPHRPRVVWLFPEQNDIKKALHYYDNRYQYLSTPRQDWQIPQHILPQDRSPEYSHPILYQLPIKRRDLPESPLLHFMHGRTFDLAFSDIAASGTRNRLLFNLSGFRQVMRAYYNDCF